MIKQKYSRDEIIEILRKNLNALKDDAVFSDCIVDIATYLVEHRMYERSQTPPPASGQDEARRIWLRRSHDRDVELHRLFQKQGSARLPESQCRMCGSPTKGAVTCPACGNLSI